MKKVLFVCLGNICRSPMAEGMFAKLIEEQGLSGKVHVASRATSTWEIGNPPHIGTQHVLNRIGYDWKDKTSQKIDQKDFQDYDYIIGMDHNNVKYLKEHAGQNEHKIWLLRDIDEKTKGEIIPDPYFDHTHEVTYRLLLESLPLWIDKIKSELS